MRIVSLLPGATEIVFALGLGDEVVGVSHVCDYPPAARQRPVLTRPRLTDKSLTSREIDAQAASQFASGEADALDTALLRQLVPDLVLTQELCGVCAISLTDVQRAIQAIEPPPRLLSLAPHTLADVLAAIQQIGEATGRRQTAQQLVVALRERIDRVAQAVATVEARPRTLCLEWLDPPWVAGHWVPELVTLAGGDDLGVPGTPSRRALWDELTSFSPEVVILMPCGFGLERTLQELERTTFPPAWAEWPAVTSRRVYAVDGSAYLNRAGPRLVDGLEILAEVIHPELFVEFAPPGGFLPIPDPARLARQHG